MAYMYERTSETIEIESLKIHNDKRQKGLSIAKMCFQPTNIYESLGSRTSDNKVNKETYQANRRAQETKQSGKQKYYVL